MMAWNHRTREMRKKTEQNILYFFLNIMEQCAYALKETHRMDGRVSEQGEKYILMRKYAHF